MYQTLGRMAMDKISVVTGANKGLGFAIVQTLCNRFNGTVYLTSRDAKRGKDACDKLKQSGSNLKYHQLDISNGESINIFCTFLRSENVKIDLLINNAGILYLKDAEETREYQAEQTLHVNFFSLVNFTEAMLPFIKENGTIVNISSSSGHLSRIPSSVIRERLISLKLSLEELKELMKGYIDDVKMGIDNKEEWGDSPYVVSKVGVNAYTFILNRRLTAKGIKVNCVHPGYVISDMTRGSGSVTPKQAAEVVADLVLEKNGGAFFWHNGEKVPWDGSDPRGYIDNKFV